MNPNPIFSKFDKVLGTTTPTTGVQQPPKWADELRAASAANQPAPVEKSIIPEAADTFKEGFNLTKEGVKDPSLSSGLQKIGRGTLKEAGAGIRAVFSPVEAATKIVSQFPVIHEALGGVDKAVSYVADKISNNKTLQEFMQKNPNADEVVGNLISIGGALIGGKVAPEAGEVVAKAGNEAADAVAARAKGIVNDVKSTVGKTPKTPVQLQADLEASGIKDTTPSYHKNLIGENPIKNPDGTTTPRVSEVDSKNPFKERTVNSTTSEVEAGKELSKVEGYDPKASALDKYNKVSEYNTKLAQNLETSLKNEKLVVPKKEVGSIVKKAVNNASQDSLLLQKTDPIVKNYVRVLQRALDKADGTIAGELEVRKALDAAYDDAGGKYGNNKGLDQIHRAARNALNDDMEARAQTTQLKASLKQQSNLYRAMDVLKDKAQAEGGSAWEQFKKAHPIISKASKVVGRAAGIGAGVHLVP